jgi:hypothetical protein
LTPAEAGLELGEVDLAVQDGGRYVEGGGASQTKDGVAEVEADPSRYESEP